MLVVGGCPRVIATEKGFIMGLFDKKYCDICGEKIGLLGNRKLDDGNLCKNCAAKLSPWFSDRRHSTVAEIKEQLAYREENKGAVAAFNITRALGNRTRVLLDENAQKFIVTSARNIQDANPDVMDYSQVTGCRIDVDESRSEIMREDSEGKEVSYNPPRYYYDYDIYVVISVNTPYFDEIRFRLNDSTIESEVRLGVQGGGRGIGISRGVPVEYDECMRLAEEIKTALTRVHADVRKAVREAQAPKTAVTCPHCGATTIPDAAGMCEYCGGALGA